MGKILILAGPLLMLSTVVTAYAMYSILGYSD